MNQWFRKRFFFLFFFNLQVIDFFPFVFTKCYFYVIVRKESDFILFMLWEISEAHIWPNI